MADYDLKIVSFGGNLINDTTNYTAGFSPGLAWGLPTVSPKLVKRDGAWPLLGGVDRGGRELRLIIHIKGAAKRTLRDQLLRWFDPEDETPKKLAIEDEDGSNDRYVYAICNELTPVPVGGVSARDAFLVTLTVDGDVRWRETTATTPSAWSITASGQTNNYTNNGTDDAHPIIDIKPTTQKSGEYLYSKFIPIKWRSDNATKVYPYRIGPIDTTGAKFRDDGYDLRVFVDGTEIDRWFVDINTANTYIWVNLDFQKQANDTLMANIPASGSINSIEIYEAIYDMPDRGLVQIDSEIFSYTARDLAEEKLTGITRAVKGSSEAAHTAGTDTVYWIQHEVVLRYGYAGASAPSIDDDWKPTFVLANSDNDEWNYTSFGSCPRSRAEQEAYDTKQGVWRRVGGLVNPQTNVTVAGGVYAGNQGTLLLDPYNELGAWIRVHGGWAFGWTLYNPCGIVNAAWSSGEMRAAVKEEFIAGCRYWVRDQTFWTYQYVIPDPASDDTWDTWSKAKDGTDWDTADQVALALYFDPGFVEASAVIVYFDTTEVPLHSTTACAEDTNNYPLNATIKNNTTGESIVVQFNMTIDQTLAIDTDEETIDYEMDSTSQFQVLSTNAVRRKWLKLQPGVNQLQYNDSNTGNVTLGMEWEERFY